MLENIKADSHRLIAKSFTLPQTWILPCKQTHLFLSATGFMGTGACLLDKESDMPCGLIIEKVNGIPCEKRLTKDESFADVRYLLEMCKQVSHSSLPADAHL